MSGREQEEQKDNAEANAKKDKKNKKSRKEKKEGKQEKIKLLVCMNDRGAGRRSCAASGANALRKHAKAETENNPRIKIKKSGCLGLCKQGPVIRILPAGTYYHCDSPADIDLVLTRHAAGGDALGHLLIKTGKARKK